MMWGIGSEPAESIETWAVMRVDLDRRADDDHAEVEGPDQGGVDGDDRERRAVVGPGEVELAGGVSQGRRRGRSRRRCGRFPRPPGSWGFELSDPGFALGRFDVGLGAVGDAGDLAESGPGAGWRSRR